jgi:hypothetical protein
VPGGSERSEAHSSVRVALLTRGWLPPDLQIRQFPTRPCTHKFATSALPSIATEEQ